MPAAPAAEPGRRTAADSRPNREVGSKRRRTFVRERPGHVMGHPQRRADRWEYAPRTCRGSITQRETCTKSRGSLSPTRCGSSRCGVSATLSADQPDLRVELRTLAGRHACFTQRVFADGLAVSRTAARRTRGRSPDRPAGAAAGQCFRHGGIRVGNRWLRSDGGWRAVLLV